MPAVPQYCNEGLTDTGINSVRHLAPAWGELNHVVGTTCSWLLTVGSRVVVWLDIKAADMGPADANNLTIYDGATTLDPVLAIFTSDSTAEVTCHA